MQVDISFSFAKVYNVEKIDVVVGQKFTLFTDSSSPIAFFSKNDAALSIEEHETSAIIEATKEGQALIFIMDASLINIIKKVVINVVDAIKEPATDLGLSAGQPEAK